MWPNMFYIWIYMPVMQGIQREDNCKYKKNPSSYEGCSTEADNVRMPANYRIIE